MNKKLDDIHACNWTEYRGCENGSFLSGFEAITLYILKLCGLSHCSAGCSVGHAGKNWWRAVFWRYAAGDVISIHYAKRGEGHWNVCNGRIMSGKSRLRVRRVCVNVLLPISIIWRVIVFAMLYSAAGGPLWCIYIYTFMIWLSYEEDVLNSGLSWSGGDDGDLSTRNVSSNSSWIISGLGFQFILVLNVMFWNVI